MPEPKSLTCPTCGAPLNYDGKSTTVRCNFCQTVTVLDSPQSLADLEHKSWLDTPVRTPVPKDILELIHAGEKDEAVRRYREVYDVSKAKATYAIAQIEAGNPQNPEFGFEVKQAEKPTRRRWPWSRR